MAEIYRGLNVNVFLADIDDKDTSLRNLGIDPEDLEAIRGIASGGVSSFDLRTIAGLDVDQKKELYAMSRTSTAIGGLLRDMLDIQRPLEFNMKIDDQLIAGAIKYKYMDFSNPSNLKSADISTSRVSSWSSAGPDDPDAVPPQDPSTYNIFYGGEVLVQGNTVEATEIRSKEAPTIARYPAEAPTHTITIDVNGQAKEFHAMKGIPLTFEGFFRNANFRGKVNKQGDIAPVWTVRNQDDNRFYETYTPNDENNPRAGGRYVSTSADNRWYFRDSLAHPRTIEFYYNPTHILEFDLNGLNLTELPNVQLPNIITYNLTYNDFYEVPRFDVISPSLENINMQGNNLSRIGVGTQTQLNRFPNTIRNISMNGCFTENVDLDLTQYTNLRVLNLSSYYSRYGRRHLSGTVTPKVNQNTIDTYNIYHQGYSRLSSSITKSTSLRYLQIQANNIAGVRDDSTGVDSDIKFDSTNLTHFYSYSNNHNIVPANSGNTGAGPKDSLQYYYHTYSTPNGVEGSGNASSVTNKFNNATALRVINLYGTSATGNIGSDFSILPSLTSLELRRTRLSGSLNDSSFANTTELQSLLLEYSNYSSSNFFGASYDSQGQLVNRGNVFRSTENLRSLYVYHNKNISGPLPDFSKNKELRVLFIYYTNLNGTIPNFSSNDRLYYIRCSSSAFTGSPPAFNGNQYYYIYLNNNNLSGSIPMQQGSNIRRLWLQFNSQINGTLPTFEFTPRMQWLRFENCSISQYNQGTLDKNTWLQKLDISNNRLNVNSVRNIVADMVENYNRNPRRGVIVNMLGQFDLAGNVVTEASVAADEATLDNLAFLRAIGWTINI